MEASQQPPRIVGKRGKLSVSKQVELVRKRKQEQLDAEQAARSGSKNNFIRRKTTAEVPPEEELRRQIEKRRKEALTSLTSLFQPDSPEHCPLLIIDGYNVVHQHADGKQLMRSGDLRRARELLISLLDEYAHLRGLRTWCVFDGQPSSGFDESNAKSSTTTSSSAFSVETIFTRGESADEYIEGAIAQELAQDDVPEVYIATSDRACGDLCGGLGALPLTSQALLRDLRHVQEQSQREMEKQNKKAERKTKRKGIGKFADMSTLSQLEQIRQQGGR